MGELYKDFDQINKFRATSVSDLLRKELGENSFQVIEDKTTEIKSMIEEMIFLTEINSSTPIGIRDRVIEFVEEFNRNAQSLMNYHFIDDAKRDLKGRKLIISNINKWYLSIFSGIRQENSSYIPQNFLQVYNTIKLTNLPKINNEKAEIDQLRVALENMKSDAEITINLLKSKASEETVEDYAQIFQNQANSHSMFNISLRPFSFRFGNAQRWLGISICLIIGFGYLINYINNNYPLEFATVTGESIPAGVVTLQLLTRLLVISFGIYIITFSFKQFNVNNHLYTVNKHRQNTLNSFKLFISSLDPSDTTTRNVLMMEVAKAIYESGQSGYISNKDSGDSNPSIIEMTRFVGKS